MRLSCQLRKYLSQFVACNGLALLDPWLPETTARSGRPITANLLAFANLPVHLSFSISSILPYFLFPSRVFLSLARMPMREQRRNYLPRAESLASRLPLRRGGNVPLTVAFDRSIFSNHSPYALNRIDVSLVLRNFI